MKRTIIIDGKEVESQGIEPILSDEKWSEYQMPNGDIVKVKLVANYFIVAPDTFRNKDGDRFYNVNFTTVLAVLSGK